MYSGRHFGACLSCYFTLVWEREGLSGPGGRGRGRDGAQPPAAPCRAAPVCSFSSSLALSRRQSSEAFISSIMTEKKNKKKRNALRTPEGGGGCLQSRGLHSGSSRLSVISPYCTPGAIKAERTQGLGPGVPHRGLRILRAQHALGQTAAPHPQTPWLAPLSGLSLSVLFPLAPDLKSNRVEKTSLGDKEK